MILSPGIYYLLLYTL